MSLHDSVRRVNVTGDQYFRVPNSLHHFLDFVGTGQVTITVLPFDKALNDIKQDELSALPADRWRPIANNVIDIATEEEGVVFSRWIKAIKLEFTDVVTFDYNGGDE